jgi:large subunit ribosomal protein L9
MRVIFKEDDRVEKVSDGYARNFLLPRRLAVVATDQAIAQAEKRREKKRILLAEKKAQMQTIAQKLEAQELLFTVDSGEGGKLFGSITSADIAAAASKASGIEIDKKKIELDEPIKAVGEYKVSVKLFPEVSALLNVKISPK